MRHPLVKSGICRALKLTSTIASPEDVIQQPVVEPPSTATACASTTGTALSLEMMYQVLVGHFDLHQSPAFGLQEETRLTKSACSGERSATSFLIAASRMRTVVVSVIVGAEITGPIGGLLSLAREPW